MDLATKSRPARTAASPRLPACSAFTLVELILVMAILGIVLAAAAPSLGRFFRGRALHSEASRFVALTHYAQNRAVSEGIPMILWIDPQRRAYGLRAEASYSETDPRAVEFKLADGISVEPEPVIAGDAVGLPWREPPVIARGRPVLRFTPEGHIPLTSPARVALREDDSTTLWIALSQNRLHYEVQPIIASQSH
jgi:type II secretion system protein H